MRSGLLLIDKPEGLTSHDVVARVRRTLKTKAVGHTGTLDPFATGLMILVIEQATKLSDYLRDSDKTYTLKAKLGVETDSLDCTGEVTRQFEGELNTGRLPEVVSAAQGVLRLPIPLFSAKKINGKKLCDYAREGQSVEVPHKDMQFFDVELCEAMGDEFKAQVSCKSGGFIRAWAQHVGEELGCGAHLQELRRTAGCGYSVDQAITLPQLEELVADANIEKLYNSRHFVEIVQALPRWKTVTVKGKDRRLLKNGQVSHDLSRRLNPEQRQAQAINKIIGVKVINGDTGGLISILEARPTAKLKIKRVFDEFING